MNLTILRHLEYKKISNLKIDGDVLDLGGSTKSGYHQLLKGEHKITTVNINKEYGCNIIFDIQKKFPLEDNSFDSVLLINVLEHIYKYENVISESNRVLKSNGNIYLAVPFIHQIHGSPNDYFRYSKSALEKILSENNFSDINIEELGFGLFSLFFQSFLIGFIPFNFLKNTFKNIMIFLDKIILKYSSRYRKWAINNPMGYWVSASKK